VTLLRLVSRIGVHIPAMAWARRSYSVAVDIGNYAFPVAAVFAAVTAAALALALIRRAPLAAVGAGIVLAAQAWLAAGAHGAGPVGFTDLLLAAGLAVIAAGAAWTGREPRACMFLGLLVVAQSLGLLQAASANFAGVSGGEPLPVTFSTAGEAVLVAALVLTPWLLRPAAWPRSALIGGVVAAALVSGAMMGNGSTTRILALWTFGLAMPAPALLYVLAAGAVTATALACPRQGRPATAAGLVFLVLGGYVPPSTYQSDLLLAGALLIAFPFLIEQSKERPA
jgi:hypothetical protein